MVGHRHAYPVGAGCASLARARGWSRAPRVAVLASLVGAVLAAIAFVGLADAASLPVGPSTGVALPANAFFGPFRFPPSRGGTYVFGRLASVACPPSGSCVAVGTYGSGEASGGNAMVVSESDGVWNQASEIAPPSSPALHADIGLDSVACPAAGSCVAIGAYFDSADEEQAMAVSESDGVWGQAIEIHGVVLQSIACRAPGSCVAIGTASGGANKIVGVIESGGVWGQPQGIPLPANHAPEYVVELAPLACQVSGPCVTVGSYTDTSHQQRAMGVSESNGIWTPANEITSAPDLEGAARLYSVACPASGPCVADGLASVAFGVSETNGEWGEASPITPPPDPSAKLTTLYSVGCPGSGQCFAVGYDETNSSFTNAVVAGASGGVWGQAREITPPPNAASRPAAHLRYVACSASESCVAIGEYTDSSGLPQAMAVTETNGEWGRASEITAPPTTSNSQTGDRANLELLACPAVGTCAALGHYQDESETWLMAAGMTTSPKTTAPESARRTTSPQKTTAPSASVSLASRAIPVQRKGWAAVKLSCRGTVKCAGILKLVAKTRPRKKRHLGKTEIIAISKFAVAPNTTAIIELKLNAAGRSLLKATHGRLGASLTVMETSPTPSHIDKQSVRLTQHR